MFRILTAAVVLLAVQSVSHAQTSDSPDTEAGRYILRRVDGGLMRVDRETGATSFCRKRVGAWVCESVPDDRVALEGEIDRLTRENAELAIEIGRLKERVAELEAPGGSDEREQAERTPETGKERPHIDLPTDEEIDQVMKSFEKMMRRFLDMVRGMRDDFEQDRT